MSIGSKSGLVNASWNVYFRAKAVGKFQKMEDEMEKDGVDVHDHLAPTPLPQEKGQEDRVWRQRHPPDLFC